MGVTLDGKTKVEMETLDHLLIGGLEVVDLLKIHVQGMVGWVGVR